MILIELVIWKLKLLIRTNRIDNYEASNTREFPWTVLQRHVTSHRERSFDIHAIFTLVSVVRVRNIAISINVLNFFRVRLEISCWLLPLDSQRTLIAPLFSLAHSTPIRSSDDRYVHTKRRKHRVCLVVSVFFSFTCFLPLFITPILFGTISVVSSDKRNRNFQWEFLSALFRA